MPDREKVIKGLEALTGPAFARDLPCNQQLLHEAIALLKAQEPLTVEPNRIDLADETKAWLDEMDAVDALGNIADICMDWDGYRTADGLGGLINEIWAYARYCADRLLKAQEPRVMTAEEVADCEEGTVLWVEERQGVTWNLFPLEIDVSSTHPDTGTNYLFFITYHDIRKFECDEYNRTWRCWTVRPTDEQRKAVKWDD